MRLLLALMLVAQNPLAPFLKAPEFVSVSTTVGAKQSSGRVPLYLDVTPKPGMHVYAPGAKDYTPITLKLNPLPAVTSGKVVYPKSEMFTFASERVPVFRAPFRLTEEVTIRGGAAPLTVTGTVEYQACDDRVCYKPETVRVSWTVK